MPSLHMLCYDLGAEDGRLHALFSAAGEPPAVPRVQPNAHPGGSFVVERRKKALTSAGVVLSIVLFVGKLYAAHLTQSIAVLSDALNSLLDILTYTAVHISVLVQHQKPDANHPFGHRRAEPLAGVLIAIFAAGLGVSIIKDGVVGLFSDHVTAYSPAAAAVLLFSIFSKGVLAALYRREAGRGRSPALRASFVDSKNDVLASVIALAGFWLGRPSDEIAGIAIGAWILLAGVRVGLENIGFLMGRAPSEDVLESMRREAFSVPGVMGLHDLRAHYVGDRLHVEMHVDVDASLRVDEAHDIGDAVRRRLEAHRLVDKAFIHIDPWRGE